MRPPYWLGLTLFAIPSCFDPSSTEGTETEGTGTTATGSGSATSPQPTDGGDSGMVDSSGDDTNPSTDGSATSTGTSSGCTDASECTDGLVCIDGECAPCSDAGDPDGACNDADPGTPVCDPSGTCAACVAGGCAVETPFCDPTAGCLPCNEHSQCPDTACHLLGPMAGQCFEPSQVIPIADQAAFETAVGATQPGDLTVLDLAAGTYNVQGTNISFADELAIIGEDGATITGGATNLFVFGGDGQIMYLSNLEITTGAFRAMRCDTPGRLWIDDTTIREYPVAVQTSCETHVRRSIIEGIDFTLSITGGTTFVENSTLVPGTSSGLSVEQAATLDIRYTNIVGGAGPAVVCTSNMAAGEVRNSIVSAPSGFESVDTNCAMQFTGNAVGPNGPGVEVGSFDATWFVDAAGGNYHLSAAGELAFDAIAQWEQGDPLVDIDGDARPQMAPAFPGVDEVP